MELICYSFQNFSTLPQEMQDSKVELVVSLEGKKRSSINFSIITLHNCSIRNILSSSKSWQNYFKIEEDEKDKTVRIQALTSTAAINSLAQRISSGLNKTTIFYYQDKLNTIIQTPLLLHHKLTALQPFNANPIGLESEDIANNINILLVSIRGMRISNI